MMFSQEVSYTKSHWLIDRWSQRIHYVGQQCLDLFLWQWYGGGASFSGTRLYSCCPARCQIYCNAQRPSRKVLFSLVKSFIFIGLPELNCAWKMLFRFSYLLLCLRTVCVFVCERAGFTRTICTLVWRINPWRIFMSEYQNRCSCLMFAWLRDPSDPVFTTPLSTI